MLLNQLEWSNISEKTKKIARYMAGNLNEHGYLMIDINEASILFNRDRNAAPWTYQIINDYLVDLAGGKYKRIAEKLKTSIAEVKNSLTYIRSLNPRPGLPYSNLSQKYIVPDAVIQKQHNSYLIIMNETRIPKLSINHYYQQLFIGNEYKEAKHFLRSHLQSANGLIRALEERQKTLYKVIETIVQEQVAFFEKGIPCLKPMNLKVVAEILQLHESTVSRAVQNKYVQTQHGFFELSFFFASGLSTDYGMATSTESVKARIKLLIENEDRRNPLSDLKIMELLVEERIQISRRTVMKYREEMQYLSSRLRGLS